MMLNSTLMVKDAWNKLPQNNVHNCIRYARLIENYDGLHFQITEHEFVEDDVVGNKILITYIK